MQEVLLFLACTLAGLAFGNGLQSKWKNIKDCYNKYLKSLKTKSGQARKNVKTYLYAAQLAFLKSATAAGPTEPSPNVVLINDDNEQEEDLDVEEEHASRSALHRRRKKTLQDKLEAYIDNFQTAQVQPKQDDCDDMCFFKSLLPMVKSIPTQQKIKLRMDLMNVVYEYSTRANNIVSPLQSVTHARAPYSPPRLPLYTPTASLFSQPLPVQETEMSQPIPQSRQHWLPNLAGTSYGYDSTSASPVYHELQVPRRTKYKSPYDPSPVVFARKQQRLEVENPIELFSPSNNSLASSTTSTEVSDPYFMEEDFA